MMGMILASDAKGGIGLNNQLPWNCSLDLSVFKALTINHTVIMGAKTWQGLLGTPLKQRKHYVLSTQTKLSHSDHQSFSDFDDLLEVIDTRHRGEIVWVIGGASIYECFAPLCTYVHHTLINGKYSCDTFFDVHTHMDLRVLQEHTLFDHGVSFKLYHQCRKPRCQKREKEIQERRKEAISTKSHSSPSIQTRLIL